MNWGDGCLEGLTHLQLRSNDEVPPGPSPFRPACFREGLAVQRHGPRGHRVGSSGPGASPKWSCWSGPITKCLERHPGSLFADDRAGTSCYWATWTGSRHGIRNLDQPVRTTPRSAAGCAGGPGWSGTGDHRNGPGLHQDLQDPARYAWFEASAALFAHELIREESSRAALADFIRFSPDTLNWQTSFLRAYRTDLPPAGCGKGGRSPRRDPGFPDHRQHWPRDRVLARLAEVFVETADFRPETNQPSIRQTVLPLRELIVEWDFNSQREVVQRKVSQLPGPQASFPGGSGAARWGFHRGLEQYLVVSRPQRAAQSIEGDT